MTPDLRIVIDTNVLLSAILLPRSVPRAAFDLARISGTILSSEATIEELEAVLRRPKFSRYVTEGDRMEFLARLVELSEIVEIQSRITVCRDGKDNKFLELAIDGNATTIISGDRDLLTLNPFRQVSIVTPHEFVAPQRTAEKPPMTDSADPVPRANYCGMSVERRSLQYLMPQPINPAIGSP